MHPGSLVQPGSSQPLVTVNQFDPVGVAFTLPENDLNAVLAAQTQGPVRVLVDNAKGVKIAGTLDFIDNTVSTESGTIALKARFANADRLAVAGDISACQRRGRNAAGCGAAAAGDPERATGTLRLPY